VPSATQPSFQRRAILTSEEEFVNIRLEIKKKKDKITVVICTSVFSISKKPFPKRR
jgi:hypothetical protein